MEKWLVLWHNDTMPDYSHSHTGTASAKHKGRMKFVLLITFIIFIAELVGAYLSNSLVLLADAGHMFADVGGIALALFAIFVASRPATDKRTFGYQRVEILAAAFNAIALLGLSCFIIFQAIIRLIEPPQVESGIMIVFGVIALICNAYSAFLLRDGQKESLNVRGAFLEVVSDMLGAAAVILAAVIILMTGWLEADAVASLFIGVLIVPRTIRLLKESIDVLLEATPKNINLSDVRKHILEIPGVVDAHDLHAWLITSGVPVLSVHVAVKNPQERDILHKLQECLKDHFDVEHSTFQIEEIDHSTHERRMHR